ncbi:branched-chain amino acid ABC transporter substrate-binding protein [Azospirillum halopraeferens]|uniref:branched-chain amino acid ABC transporter substrate-binding protein n=1 Tax=Azospirillum halopraeferens TaxID=34010 RepID=UPI000428DF83|nr:branched-chain amino acid ABC transporter substrate-binding protein [Azospirillum halopraeferens]
MNRSIPFIGAALLLAAPAAAQADIVIGLGTATTGAVAALGEQTVYGARQAIEDINARGGVLGRQLVLRVGDDACDPRQAVAVANRFATEGVVAVNGHLCSGSAIPASEVYNEEGIVMVTPTATSPALTDRGYDTVFRVCGRDDQQGVVAGRFLAERYAGRRVAVLDDKQSYGRGLADVVARTLEEAGTPVAFRASVTAGERDFSALVTNLKERGIEAVFYGGYHPELGLIVRQARELGLDARFVAGDGLNNAEFWSITGPAGQGTLFTDSEEAASSEAGRQLVESFRRAGLSEPGNFAFYSYATVQVIAQGLQQAGEADGGKLAAALRAGTFDTVVGQIRFDAKGDNVNPNYVLYEWSEGRYAPYTGN